MQAKKPRRPAIIEPETLEYLEGEEDPALSSESAHTSARILIRAPKGEWSDPDSETKSRLLGYLATHGVDELAELWADSPAETLPGTLWRLLLLDEWMKRFPQQVAARFKQGMSNPKLSRYIDVQGARTIDFPDWRKRLGSIMTGEFHQNFADFLDESQAVLRVLAASEEIWIKESQSDPLSNAVTTRDSALLNTAEELLNSASLYREGRLD